MLKPTRGIACLLALGMMAAYVQAGETAGTCTKAKSACCSKSGAKALVTNVVYRVNETETPCSETAAKLAEESGSKIEYVAAGKSFDNELDAKSALAEQIEAAVAEMLEVRYAVNGQTTSCATSAKMMASKNGGNMTYRAVGRDFDCEDKANNAVAKAKVVLAKLEGKGGSCCASGASKASAVAASSAKITCAGKAAGEKTACAGAASSAVTAAKASGDSCCASKIKAAAAAGEQAPSCCQKKLSTVAADASACPKTKAVDAALVQAKAKYDAMLSLSNNLVVADATSKG